MKFLGEFSYHRPKNLDEFIQFRDEFGRDAAILAGGTDLLIHCKSNEPPPHLLDIGGLAELKGIEDKGDVIRIGSTVTMTQLETSPLIRQELPLLAQAAAAVGSKQIRNAATVGGNLVNASPAADTVPAFIAMDAVCEILGRDGLRTEPIGEMILSPYRSKLAPGELLTAFSVPKLPAGTASHFRKIGRRKAVAISILSISILLHTKAGKIDYAAIVPGAALPKACRLRETEAMLLGKAPTAELFTAAGKKAAEEVVAVTGVRHSTEYKAPTLSNITGEGLMAAWKELSGK